LQRKNARLLSPRKLYKASRITRSSAKIWNALAKPPPRLLLRHAPPHKLRRPRPARSRRCPCENSPTYRTTQICLHANSKIARPSPEIPQRDPANLARKFRISYSRDLCEFSLSSIANPLRNSLLVIWLTFACAHAIQRLHNLQRQAFRALSLPIVSRMFFCLR